MTFRQLEPPGVYEHWKGGHYRLLHHALLSGDCSQRVVVYVSLLKGIVWVRPQPQWSEPVQWPDGTEGPRFRYVGHNVPGYPP